jgi:hypothetical protein
LVTVGALYSIVFHIQAVMDFPDHCAWQLGLQVVSSQNSSQQKLLRSPWYAHFHATNTIWICSRSRLQVRCDSNIVVESGAPDRYAGLEDNYHAKALFEQADSEAKGESTVLQNRTHPSQKKFFDLLGTHICMPLRQKSVDVGDVATGIQ